MLTITIVLALLLLLVTIQSSGFYFAKLKVNFIEWLFFNACAPSNLVFLGGVLLFLSSNNRVLLYVAILPMFFFGTLGMFFLPWKGMNIIPQFAHIIMTLNIAWITYVTVTQDEFIAATTGLLIGVLVFAPFIAVQQGYTRRHPERLQRLLLDIKTIGDT